MYINNKIAAAQAAAQPLPVEPVFSSTSESNAEIVRSVREALANYEDPTIMHQLQKELAIKEDRWGAGTGRGTRDRQSSVPSPAAPTSAWVDVW